MLTYGWFFLFASRYLAINNKPINNNRILKPICSVNFQEFPDNLLCTYILVLYCFHLYKINCKISPLMLNRSTSRFLSLLSACNNSLLSLHTRDNKLSSRKVLPVANYQEMIAKFYLLSFALFMRKFLIIHVIK